MKRTNYFILNYVSFVSFSLHMFMVHMQSYVIFNHLALYYHFEKAKPFLFFFLPKNQKQFEILKKYSFQIISTTKTTTNRERERERKRAIIIK